VPDSCAKYAGTEVVCAPATCVDAVQTSESHCDAKGACNQEAGMACGGYICGGDANCLTTCNPDRTKGSDCATGYRCTVDPSGASAPACLPANSQCTDDHTSHGENGDTDCGNYKCDVAAGTCLQNCLATSDCVDGFVCNPSNKSCEKADSGSAASDSGCGCRMAGDGAAGGGTVAGGSSLFGLLLAGLTLSRRRSRTSRPKSKRARPARA
jgi:hypothetical protein